MAMSTAEQASLCALRKGATLAEAVAILPELTPEQLAQLDENGDLIQPSERLESCTTKPETSPRSAM